MSGVLVIPAAGLAIAGLVSGTALGISKASQQKEKLEKSRERLKKEQHELAASKEKLNDSLNDLVKSERDKKKAISNLEEEANKMRNVTKELKKQSKSALADFKKKRIESIKQETAEFEDEELKELAQEKINQIKKCLKEIEVRNIYVDFVVDIEEIIDDKLKQQEKELEKYNRFGINIDEELDNISQEKLNNLVLYENLLELGYNPTYNKEEDKIIIKKDNDDQIIVFQEDEELKLEFHDYKGKDCMQDMINIEREFKKKGILEKSAKVYNEWYTQQEKENNRGKVRKNNERYKKYQKQVSSVRKKEN